MAKNYCQIDEGFDGHLGTQFGSTSISFDMFLQYLHHFLFQKRS